MATLDADRANGAVEFMRMRWLRKATDGNLGAHLSTFRNHVTYLRDVVDGV